MIEIGLCHALARRLHRFVRGDCDLLRARIGIESNVANLVMYLHLSDCSTRDGEKLHICFRKRRRIIAADAGNGNAAGDAAGQGHCADSSIYRDEDEDGDGDNDQQNASQTSQQQDGPCAPPATRAPACRRTSTRTAVELVFILVVIIIVCVIITVDVMGTTLTSRHRLPSFLYW